VNLVADTEYCSEANLFVCAEKSVIPLLAVGRGSHHHDPLDRDLPEPQPRRSGRNGDGKDAGTIF